ncbi:unnamed protein product, partial [Rotaria sordida]
MAFPGRRPYVRRPIPIRRPPLRP